MKEQIKVDVDRQEWYLNGQLHREDGPVCIDDNYRDYRDWDLNDYRHYEDVPAIIDGDYQA